LQHAHLGVEHLFNVLTARAGGHTQRLLASLGLDPRRLREDWRREAGTGKGTTGSKFRPTARLIAVLARAGEHAEDAGLLDEALLLRAVIEEGQSLPMRHLAALGHPAAALLAQLEGAGSACGFAGRPGDQAQTCRPRDLSHADPRPLGPRPDGPGPQRQAGRCHRTRRRDQADGDGPRADAEVQSAAAGRGRNRQDGDRGRAGLAHCAGARATGAAGTPDRRAGDGRADCRNPVPGTVRGAPAADIEGSGVGQRRHPVHRRDPHHDGRRRQRGRVGRCRPDVQARAGARRHLVHRRHDAG